MNQLAQKIIFSLLFSVFLLCPFFSQAIVQLEQSYPSIGEDIVAVQEKPTPVKLIKYYSEIAVMVAAIAALIFLIVGGLQYATSTGNPAKIREAKDRIYNSFLGLAIIIFSFMILKFINPQVAVLTLKYQPVQTGIFLFTEKGLQEFKNETRLKDLVDSKQAFFLSHSIENLSDFLGDLAVEKPEGYDGADPQTIQKLNFGGFPLYAVGIWGEKESGTQVVFYPDTYYRQILSPDNQEVKKARVIYTYQGIVDESGNIKTDQGETGENFGMKWFVLPDFESKVSFQNRALSNWEPGAELSEEGDFPHPPLSAQITRTGPGVYLYSANNEERYFSQSSSDLSDSFLNFDKMADKIKIVNTTKTTNEQGEQISQKTNDFLAVLHSGDFFSGHIRFFFEGFIEGEARKIDKEKVIPDYMADEYFFPQIFFNNDSLFEIEIQTMAEMKKEKIDCNSFLEGLFSETKAKKNQRVFVPLDKAKKCLQENFVYHHLNSTIGNMANNMQSFVNPDRYTATADNPLLGELQDHNKKFLYGWLRSSNVSSVSLFDIAHENNDPSKPIEQTVCQEVKVCTGTNKDSGFGDCIVYKQNPDKINENFNKNSIELPMPFFYPVNLPEIIPVVDEVGNDKVVFRAAKFNNNIKSIHITGNCLVALLDNPVGKDKQEDGTNGTKEQTYSYIPEGAAMNADEQGTRVSSVLFESLGTGNFSQLFTETVSDLTKHHIHQCGSFFRKTSCASSIVVFPIR